MPPIRRVSRCPKRTNRTTRRDRNHPPRRGRWEAWRSRGRGWCGSWRQAATGGRCRTAGFIAPEVVRAPDIATVMAAVYPVPPRRRGARVTGAAFAAPGPPPARGNSIGCDRRLSSSVERDPAGRCRVVGDRRGCVGVVHAMARWREGRRLVHAETRRRGEGFCSRRGAEDAEGKSARSACMRCVGDCCPLRGRRGDRHLCALCASARILTSAPRLRVSARTPFFAPSRLRANPKP